MMPRKYLRRFFAAVLLAIFTVAFLVPDSSLLARSIDDVSGSLPTTGGAQEVLSATSTADNPLVLVLDLSSSMRENDGEGENKLIAAKASVERMLRAQGQGAVVGLWTYPNDADCGAGQFVIDPQPVDDLTTTIASVDLLTAGGGTPTGKALRGSVDALKASGYDRATIVLVSDGESNCSSPPCPVAQGLAGSGFDITVDAVGFQQSETGRKELTCVANATGGRYFDAEDGDELIQRLDELSSASVRVDVRHSPTAYAGSSTQIAATLTNPSSRQAKDVRVHLAFQNVHAGSVMPAVLPPTYLVGNIEPGSSVTRTWTVSTGIRDANSEARFTVTAWGNAISVVRVPGSISISTDGMTRNGLSDLLEEIRDTDHPLVIMGDSYSSGEGTENYIDADDDCHRSMSTYVAPLFKDVPERVRIIACSGALTGDVYKSQHAWTDSGGATSQLAQLADVQGPGAVLMTFGGNDIGFASIIKSCILGTAKWSCGSEEKFLEGLAHSVAGLRQSLSEVYREVWREANESSDIRARDGAFAPLIVLAYPQITHDASRGGCPAYFNASEVSFTNRLSVLLNATIKQAVGEVRDAGYEVYFAGPVQAAFLPGNTACATGDEAYVHGLLGVFPTPPESFHPKVQGYTAETAALFGWLGSVERVDPDPALVMENDDGMVSRILDSLVARVGRGTADFTRMKSSRVTQQGVLEVAAAGYAPDSPVTFVLNSTPTTLGTLLADGQGNINGEFWVPMHVIVGDHSLSARGFALDGEIVHNKLPVRVSTTVPWLVPVAFIFGASCAVAAIVLAVLGLVRRRRA